MARPTRETASSVSRCRSTKLISYAWGDKYLDELLEVTIPAILAPGNLPHLASIVPCEMVLLIEERAHERVSSHPNIERIQRHCSLRLVGLDDLIAVKDKYGMALTHALHRGMGATSGNILDTYFIFLNADFVMADGCLSKVLERLMSGERLVAAPSYCVVSKTVIPRLRERIDRDTGVLSIANRDLAHIALHNLHDTIRAKTLNQRQWHFKYVDQFYWQLDRHSLLGHQMPVAIVGMRPERFIKEPNSYWDHGFMRELCPYAEPCVLGDSDDFLMVELREKEVAQEHLVAGPMDLKRAGRRMIMWLTQYQREFAQYPLQPARPGPAPDGPGGTKRACQARARDFVLLPASIAVAPWTSAMDLSPEGL